jgi:glutathione S-transferase
MTNTLYCFGESGNAYKAALTLELSGMPWSPRFVDFFKGEARSPEFRAINPMGEVPVLDADGTILTQSGVIQDWVMDETGKLCGDGSQGTRREILRWTIFDNQKVSGMAGPLRFMMNFLPEDKRSDEVNGFLAGRLKAALQVLEANLSVTPRLAGGRQPHLRRSSPAAAISSTRNPSPSTARLPRHRRLAHPHRRHARLETPLRPDAARLPGRVTLTNAAKGPRP